MLSSRSPESNLDQPPGNKLRAMAKLCPCSPPRREPLPGRVVVTGVATRARNIPILQFGSHLRRHIR